jgi:hypothetical protein
MSRAQLLRTPGFLLRRYFGAGETNPTYQEDVPTEPSETEPVAPAVSENPPSSFQLAQLEAARRPAPARPAAQQNESSEVANALEQFQAAYRERLAAAQPPQLSTLDMLRKRLASNMQNEALQRVSEFGAGMAATGSPNFFTMLAGGARAQAEGDRTRMDELRRVVEAERQARAQQAEEQYRRDQLEIERQRRDFERDPRNPRNLYYAARAETDATAAASARAENSARNAASTAADRAVQAENNRRSRAVPVPLPALTETEAATLRNTVYLQGLRERGFSPPAGAPVATPADIRAAPAARVNALGEEIQ